MAVNDDGGVFPVPLGTMNITLRDYFAATAMQGCLADPSVQPNDNDGFKALAAWSYGMADVMLAEREK